MVLNFYCHLHLVFWFFQPRVFQLKRKAFAYWLTHTSYVNTDQRGTWILPTTWRYKAGSSVLLNDKLKRLNDIFQTLIILALNFWYLANVLCNIICNNITYKRHLHLCRESHQSYSFCTCKFWCILGGHFFPSFPPHTDTPFQLPDSTPVHLTPIQVNIRDG